MLKKLFGLGGGGGRKRDTTAASLGIDPEMRYCPDCGDEYRADIETCAGCGVALVSGEERLREAKHRHKEFNSRSMEIGDNEARVAIRHGKLRDLKPSQLLLARERIPALLVGQPGGCSSG